MSGKEDPALDKKVIFDELKRLKQEPRNKEEAETIIKDLTKLDLKESNYKTIISKLIIIKE